MHAREVEPGPQFPLRFSSPSGAWRRVLVLAVSLLCTVTGGHALTLATYNLENYTVADRVVEGVFHQAYPKPEKERRALVQVIAGLKPDILAVQEMGPAPFLEDFRDELRASGQDFPHAVLLEADDPDRHVALLSKFPPKQVRRYVQLSAAFLGRRERVKRGVLEAIFATDRGDVSIFVVHLKSKRTEHGTDDPESAAQRAAEAEAVRDLVLARFPDPRVAKFIVCGDWNDTRGARPVRALQQRGQTEIGELVPAVDSRGEAWTHRFGREDTYQRVDYILVSPALKPFVVPNSGRVWDGPGANEASDHRAVAVKFDLGSVPE